MSSLEDLTPDARDELARLARELAEDPSTREQFLRLTKQKRQNLTIDSIDLKDQFNARFEEMQSKNEALEAKLREKEALEELEKRRQALIKKGKAKSEDDVAEIEKVILEKGITNHETSADYFDYMKQAAQPTAIQAFDRSFMNEQARDSLAKFRVNPSQAARDEAAKALFELRKNPRPIGF
jgi:predicted phage gp36 major capsid-like protein